MESDDGGRPNQKDPNLQHEEPAHGNSKACKDVTPLSEMKQNEDMIHSGADENEVATRKQQQLKQVVIDKLRHHQHYNKRMENQTDPPSKTPDGKHHLKDKVFKALHVSRDSSTESTANPSLGQKENSRQQQQQDSLATSYAASVAISIHDVDATISGVYTRSSWDALAVFLSYCTGWLAATFTVVWLLIPSDTIAACWMQLMDRFSWIWDMHMRIRWYVVSLRRNAIAVTTAYRPPTVKKCRTHHVKLPHLPRRRRNKREAT